jgi:hypothetical protein
MMPTVISSATALLTTLCSDNPHLEIALSTLLRFSKDTSTSVGRNFHPTSESLKPFSRRNGAQTTWIQ